MLLEASVERVKVDVFYGYGVAVPAIELAAALSFSDIDPVGCPIAGTTETIPLDKSLQKTRPISVSVLPIAGQTLGGGGQDAGGEVRSRHPRQDQEPGVVDDSVQVGPTLVRGPADEPITWATFHAAAPKPRAANKCPRPKTR